MMNSVPRSSRSWIDIFAGCGPVMGRILSFLDEIDLLQLERSNEGITADMTVSQWAYLGSLDRSKVVNQRWRHQSENDGNNGDNHLSRLRGIDFASNFLYARKRASEAFQYFDLGRDNASPEDIPIRYNAISPECSKPKNQKHFQYQRQSMPPCWEKWFDFHSLTTEGNELLILDVFLDISFHRDDPRDILSWRGFRKARYQKYQGISVKLDLESLVQEMGWIELLEFRNQSKDYAFTQFEKLQSEKQTKCLMQKIQITMHIAGGNYHQSPPSENDPLLIIATGGFASPAWAQRGNHTVFARSSNICRFHCRNGRVPLSGKFEDASRSAFLRIPTTNSLDQSLGIMLKIYD